MKVCIRCHQKKPLNEFYAHPKMADGHNGKCKSCCREAAKQRIRDPEAATRIKEYESSRAKLPHRKKLAINGQTRRRREEPEKYKARTAVGNALRDGRLTRGPCEHPGCDRKAEAHHDDYLKPLEVRWFCKRHHEDHHHPL